MEYISVGKIMEAFALKGEVKIASDFKLRDSVFQCGNKLYIGQAKKEVTITKSRFYKNRFFVLFNDVKHISQIEGFLKETVYFKKSDLDLNNDYLDDDLIGFEVINKGQNIGNLIGIRYINPTKSILEVQNKEIFYIPNEKQFVKKIDFTSKKIIVEVIEGMIK